jgi:hypothetical protein
MGVGIGILLVALGAILAFAVTVAVVDSVNVHVVGWILMIVGTIAILLSLMFWSSWAGPGYLWRRRTPLDDL